MLVVEFKPRSFEHKVDKVLRRYLKLYQAYRAVECMVPRAEVDSML